MAPADVDLFGPCRAEEKSGEPHLDLALSTFCTLIPESHLASQFSFDG